MTRRIASDKKKLVDKLRTMPIIEVACKQAGIPRSTYYRWRNDDDDFASQCDEAIAQGAELINDMAESQLIGAIKDKNMSAIAFWLKHHHRSYGTKVAIDAKIRDESALTDEQIEVVKIALAKAGLIHSETTIGRE